MLLTDNVACYFLVASVLPVAVSLPHLTWKPLRGPVPTIDYNVCTIGAFAA
jgi:hypothetical protein